MVRRTLPGIGRPRGLVLLSLVMLLGSLAWAPSVSAATIRYVALLPTAIGDGSSCASPGYNDIGSAVAAAVAGDTVHICAGTYALPSFIFINVDLTLEGDSAASTIIDGSDTRPLFSGGIGKTISFVSLTLQNGRSFAGGVEDGGAIRGATTVNVTNSIFKDNDAVGLAGSGGAIKAGTVNVTNSTFSGNTAVTNGGAIQAVTVTATNSTFSDNVASTFDGGAIYGTTVTVTDSTFSANHATNAGGAILGVTTTVVDSSFMANTTDVAGGAIAGSALTATGSTFHANTAGSVGGAVAETTATVTNSTFSNNTAPVDGGAIKATTVTATNSTFSANTADVDGGAIRATGTASVTTSTFSANAAANGGAILADSVTVTNSTFSANAAVSGGAIFTTTADLANSTFSANSAGANGGAIDSIFANVTNTVIAQPTATNNCFAIITDGGGNFSTDVSCGFSQPTSQVVTPAQLALGSLASNGGPTQTIALGATSVARDAGIDAVCAAAPVNGLDQRGISRPQGLHCDSGAYEYVAPVAPPAPAPTPVPLTLTKGVATSQAGPFGATLTAPLGSTVWYALSLTNTGSSPLAGISLVDTASAATLPAGCPALPASLAAGAVYTCTYSASVTSGTTTSTATATVGGSSISSTATVTAGPAVLTDSIAPGVNRGSTGFGTSSVVLDKPGYVTYLVKLDPSLAGQTVELWTRTRSGAWVKTTSRLVAADGTVHYYRRISAWTGFWAKLADGASHARIGTVR